MSKFKILFTEVFALRRAVYFFAVCFVVPALCCLSGASLYSQTRGISGMGVSSVDESSLSIGKISYKFEGPRNVSEDAVAAHIKLRPGMKFDQKSLDMSLRSLYNTGLYDFIDVKRTAGVGGTLDLNFVILAKYKIAQIVFKGNNTYSAARLRKEIDSYAGAILSEVVVKRDIDKIFEYYQKKGFSLAKINYVIERNDENGTGAIIFNIDEGVDVQIQNIRFIGSEEIEKNYGFWGRMGKRLFGRDKKGEINSIKLASQMKTDTWIPLISHVTDNGRFKQDEFQTDLESLRKFFRNSGYLDVEIDENKVKFEFPDPDEPGDMDIVIEINQGKQYYVGEVSFKGNTLFTKEKLWPFISLNNLNEGDVFSPSVVDFAIEEIRTFYGEYGYIDTIVRALRRPNIETGRIDLVVDIIESQKYYLESINIQGNWKTKSDVIIRELALAPGDIFDLYRMKVSEKRLKEMRYFDEVSLTPENTSIPSRRNLRIVVKEGRTGNLTFGAGFSTVESLVATVELTQGNFDITNYKNYFQGAGQKFRIRGTLGLESNQIILTFEEPWVCNRELAYGVDLYRTDTGYYSDYYSEVRLGMSHYLRKRLFERVEGRLGYKLENVDIYDVSKRAPQIIHDQSGNTSISQISLSFLREDRDSLMMPTKGTRLEFIQDLAGGPLMGDTNLYRIEGRAGIWIPTFDLGNQVFSIVGRAGTVMGYGGKEVPFFERYYLGGGYNMRGFKYRKVGPIDSATEEPLGGNTFAFISVEYSVELFSPVRFAVFYDWGFVNKNDWDWNPSDYNSDFGVGLRIMLMGAPMRVDLGFPITTGDLNKDGMQFNFSFGTVF